jgi:hypothetical protein
LSSFWPTPFVDLSATAAAPISIVLLSDPLRTRASRQLMSHNDTFPRLPPVQLIMKIPHIRVLDESKKHMRSLLAPLMKHF